MKYTGFHEQQFRSSVQKALRTVATILEAERHPVLAAEEPHEYRDKFALAEFLTNTAVAAQANALSALGLPPDQLPTLYEWAVKKTQSVTLRFLAEDACSFLKEEDVEVQQRPGGHHEVITTTETKKSGGLFGSHSNVKEETTTTRVVVRVKEYHWKVGVRYKLIVFPGTNLDEAITLQQRASEMVLITQQSAISAGGKIKAPLPERTSHPPVDASLTWLVRMIAPQDQTCQFAIDRTTAEETCKTPRRNENVQQAVDFYKQFADWARVTQGFFLERIEKEILGEDNPVHQRPTPTPKQGVNHNNHNILEPGATGTMQELAKEPSFNGKTIRIVEYNREQQRYKVEPVDPKSGLPPTLSIKPANIQPDQPPSGRTESGRPLHTVSDEGIFCPVLPLMEDGAVLPLDDAGALLQEQMRTLDDALDVLARDYPSKQLVKLVSVAEASIVLLCKHLTSLAIQYKDGVDYVEDMLKQQLIQAVGKEIDRSDFKQFVRFYNAKFFGARYAPAPFSHAIRRPGRYPDGILSIESTTDNDEPIETWVRSVSGHGNPSVFIPINAATSIEITGDRFLHGWMQHRFKSKYSNTDHQLACRARQFSSFLVILGTIAGPDKFEPKHAIILQNKDELMIPLTTAVLPSAKEFKDSIQSLSPEQQEFAKAYRSMQLESSVFGVCVIQLKPQLEKLLGLPDGALTKEIQLTQDLMSLFVDYQIPSDLLTFDGPADATVAETIASVKGYVNSVLEVIDESKKNQLKDEERKADMRHEEQRSPKTDIKVDTKSDFQSCLRAANSTFDDDVDMLSFANVFGGISAGGRQRFMTAPSTTLSTILEGGFTDSELPKLQTDPIQKPAKVEFVNNSTDDDIFTNLPARPERKTMRAPRFKKKGGSLNLDVEKMLSGHDGLAVDNEPITPKVAKSSEEIEKLGEGFLDSLSASLGLSVSTPEHNGEEKRAGSLHNGRRMRGQSSIDWTLQPGLDEKTSASQTNGQDDNEISLECVTCESDSKPPQEDLCPSENRSAASAEDFTLIPKELDAKLEKHDKEGSLRSTIITAGTHWKRIRQEFFFTSARKSTLDPDATSKEKKKAFDLLDAISRSGTLAIESCELHVVVAMSHWFENDIIGTIVQDNVNPIAKLERSSLMLATTIYRQPATDLLRSEQDALRLRPMLLESESHTISSNEQRES